MKRILFGISALFLLASCSGNGASKKAQDYSAAQIWNNEKKI